MEIRKLLGLESEINIRTIKLHISTSEHKFFLKFYSHQLMQFFIQFCISLLSYTKIT